MKIISLYPNFANQGGAQDVLIQLATNLNDSDNLPIVYTDTQNKDIDKKYIGRAEFHKFSISEIVKKGKEKETIILSHDRRYTTILAGINSFLCRKIKLIHIAHNVFFDKRLISLFPSNIIAVSEAVKNNLITIYNVPDNNIKVIYNGIRNNISENSLIRPEGKIKIFLPGRINKIKRQVDIVLNLKNNLNDNIEISFAGTGPDEDLLIENINGDSHFKYIGHVDIGSTLPKYDYVLLFSEKEGLPLSLIEGCMYSKPLITNDIKPVLEVNKEDYNGFVFSSFDELITGLNDLPNRDSLKYKEMSMNSRNLYIEKFTEDKMLSEYSSYIQGLL